MNVQYSMEAVHKCAITQMEVMYAPVTKAISLEQMARPAMILMNAPSAMETVPNYVSILLEVSCVPATQGLD